MNNRNEYDPLFDGEQNEDRDRTLKDDLGATTNPKDLSFNEEKNSFEYDVESNDPEYDHPDPYDTSAPNGEDDNSTYDEANPYVGDEYDKNLSLENDVEKLGMHIDTGSIAELNSRDEALAQTPEDRRNDLDEEGYPKNDRENFK